jgi:hypothetical protein
MPFSSTPNKNALSTSEQPRHRVITQRDDGFPANAHARFRDDFIVPGQLVDRLLKEAGNPHVKVLNKPSTESFGQEHDILPQEFFNVTSSSDNEILIPTIRSLDKPAARAI